MLTIHDLLKDPTYKEFFCKVPPIPEHLYAHKRLPWRLYVLLKGASNWKVKKFDSYPAAFRTLKRLMQRGKVLDAAIHCGGYSFEPPKKVVRVKGKYMINSQGKKQQVTKLVAWKPKIPEGEYEEHYWCPWCRRPTTFKRFTTHHALRQKNLGGVPIDPLVLRCTICGASERIVNLRRA